MNQQSKYTDASWDAALRYFHGAVRQTLTDKEVICQNIKTNLARDEVIDPRSHAAILFKIEALESVRNDPDFLRGDKTFVQDSVVEVLKAHSASIKETILGSVEAIEMVKPTIEIFLKAQARNLGYTRALAIITATLDALRKK